MKFLFPSKSNQDDMRYKKRVDIKHYQKFERTSDDEKRHSTRSHPNKESRKNRAQIIA